MVYNRKPEGEHITVAAIKGPQPPQEPRTVHLVTTSEPPANGTTGTAPGAKTVFSFKTGQDTDTAPQISAAPTVKRSDFARAFYTVPQAAEVLQVHENTIYNLVRAGKVEHYKVGAQIRIARAELERLKVERKA